MARLPKLSAQQPIVNPDRKPSSPFLQFMEATRSTQEATDTRQDAADARQDEADEAILALVADLAAVNAAQTVIIDQLSAIVLQGQTVAMQAQQAQAAANAAQQTADEALANGTVSGSATDPSVTVGGFGGWVQGPQVDLVGVVAGNLTITGTGPQQDDDVAFVIGTTFTGEYRVVEIDGMTETVLGVFSMSATGNGFSATVTNNSVAAVEAFSMALTTTGNLSYRIDVQQTSGGELTDLLLYIYARRAA